MSKSSQIAMAMFTSMKERVIFTYFKSLELAEKEVTPERMQIAEEVWEDMVDFAIFTKGDIGMLLEAGLEVVIDEAIDDYMQKG
jgi:hypothetical protein